MFKLGVDDFCYHRRYGWIIPGQSDPGKRWTQDDFLDRATELKLDAVSMETCFMPDLDRSFLESLRKKLEDRGIEGMLSWGHPRGLETGKNKEAAADLDQTIKSLNSKSGPTATGRDVPAKSFSALKGLLNMPVKGKIVAFFGPHKNKAYKTVNFQSGIEIKSEVGEPVRAVYDGQVLYASWFKGYGNMIIIDHKNNYYTVYAHAQDLFASKGDTVEMGEVVATVGDSGSMIGPSLHFEVRHHGKPLDPLEWIKKS